MVGVRRSTRVKQTNALNARRKRPTTRPPPKTRKMFHPCQYFNNRSAELCGKNAHKFDEITQQYRCNPHANSCSRCAQHRMSKQATCVLHSGALCEFTYTTDGFRCVTPVMPGQKTCKVHKPPEVIIDDQPFLSLPSPATVHEIEKDAFDHLTYKNLGQSPCACCGRLFPMVGSPVKFTTIFRRKAIAPCCTRRQSRIKTS